MYETNKRKSKHIRRYVHQYMNNTESTRWIHKMYTISFKILHRHRAIEWENLYSFKMKTHAHNAVKHEHCETSKRYRLWYMRMATSKRNANKRIWMLCGAAYQSLIYIAITCTYAAWIHFQLYKLRTYVSFIFSVKFIRKSWREMEVQHYVHNKLINYIRCVLFYFFLCHFFLGGDAGGVYSLHKIWPLLLIFFFIFV